MPCLAPITLDNGVQAACRNCWQCKLDRIDDWVGRCIAERQTSVGCHSVTLTYARDLNEKSTTYGEAEHERAAVLTYSDVQIFLKRLRNWGYPMRYVVAGEYGTMKGRAHWHIILFWTKKIPKIPALGQREIFWNVNPETGEVREDENGVPLKFWDWGVTFWEKPEYEHFRYNVKYIQKDETDAFRQGHFSMSKKPPIGSKYFFKLAMKMAKEGVAPQTLEYSWPDVRKKNDERRRFFMHGTTADNFCEAFINSWCAIHGKRHIPQSEPIEKYLDKVCPGDTDLRFEPYRRADSPFATIFDHESELWVQRGIIEARKWGEHLTLADLRANTVWEEKENTWYLTLQSGRWISWRKAENGDHCTWRDVKAEIAHQKFLKLYAAAAERARQEGRPGLIKLGESPKPRRKPGYLSQKNQSNNSRRQ